MELREVEKIDLEKVPATDDEKKYWSEILQAEVEAQERLQILRKVSARLAGEKAESEADLAKLQEVLPEIILKWALLGKSRKPILDHREKIVATVALITDYEAAILLIEKQQPACGHRISKGLHVRTKIERRKKEAENENQAKG